MDPKNALDYYFLLVLPKVSINVYFPQKSLFFLNIVKAGLGSDWQNELIFKENTKKTRNEKYSQFVLLLLKTPEKSLFLN